MNKVKNIIAKPFTSLSFPNLLMGALSRVLCCGTDLISRPCFPGCSIHICLTLQHVPVVDDFIKDLQESVQTVSWLSCPRTFSPSFAIDPFGDNQKDMFFSLLQFSLSGSSEASCFGVHSICTFNEFMSEFCNYGEHSDS